ncbi:hypothetical protein [Chitinophaga barathri]|uniref:hypothetical protein n=1 Tax=Chitinophaga barathri TaxID=1647451 RepID=UPI0013C3FD58|nr:hypothetical protein [Chitinophaga barathri]
MLQTEKFNGIEDFYVGRYVIYGEDRLHFFGGGEQRDSLRDKVSGEADPAEVFRLFSQ